MPDGAVRCGRVLTQEGFIAATVHIEGGRIARIERHGDAESSGPVLMPGVVDSHVHINEPGRTEWEGFETATRAAAAGGATTLVDMPLNSIPATTSQAALDAKRAAAQGRCSVDVGFWGGVVPGNADKIEPLRDAGVLGFKCFLVPSGVDEFPCVSETDLRVALPILARLGVPLLVHAESPAHITAVAGFPRRYSAWLDSRPPAAEHEAISMMIRLSREFGARVHIVHLASGDAIPLFGDPLVTVETCPHYLTFAAEDIPDAATEFKCAPPIRGRRNRETLWSGLTSGMIRMIATDHSPCPPDMKRRDTGDFAAAWGGIASLQFSLPIVWTEARRRTIALECLAQWMCAAPARLAGLSDRKGAIAEGLDADLVVFDPDSPPRAEIHHRHKLTPYRPGSLTGRVEQTWLRGELVYDRGDFASTSAGELISQTHLRPFTSCEFAECCGSQEWVRRMMDRQPFRTFDDLRDTAASIWRALAPTDWLEAFAAHPEIGQSSAARWSQQEQSGTHAAPADVLRRLVEGNRAYRYKFGHIFLICAAGKSAEEMLAALEVRMSNDPATELHIAAHEQERITALRLAKLL